MPAISASAPTRSCSRASRTPTWSCWSAGAARRDPVAGLHAARHPRAAADRSCMCIPAPRSSAASIVRISRSTRRRPPSRPRSKACSRPTTSPGASGTEAAHARLSRLERHGDRRSPGALRFGEIMALAARARCRPTRSSATAPAISRPGCTASSRSARFGTQLAPTSGSMGYGVPAAVGAKRLYPERTVVVLRRRRRFPDERPGIRDRRAIRPADPRRRHRQRHVRHDPHAPGARISRPRRRRPTLNNPDFAAYARAFGGFGETRRDDGGLRARLRARRRVGQARDHPLLIDPEAITPTTTLTALREAALRRK